MAEPKSLTDNIPHEYILMPNIKHAFDPEGVGLKWSLEECEFKKSSNQYISVVYYLKDTNYAVVDIDTDDYTLDQLYEDTGIDNMWTKGNSKGYHVWVEFSKGKPDAYRKNVVNCSNLCEMDYLGEKVFERVGKTWTGEFPCHIHAEQFKKCFIKEKFTKKAEKAEKAEKKTENSSNIALLKDLVDLIDMKYCDNRSDWLKILFAMKRCGFTEEEAREWSSQSERYTENGFDTAWAQYSAEEITAGNGTIRYYANLSNSGEYWRLTKEPFPTAPTEKDYSELFWELAGDCCIVSNNTMYLYYKNMWRIVDKNEPHILRTMIGDTLRVHFQKILINVESNGIVTKISDTARYIAEMCKRNKLSNVTSFVMDKMYSEHCDTEDIFDNKPYIFAFKNKAFDLKTGLPYDIKKEDYITQNTGRDYLKPTDTQLATVAKVFHSIFPDPEVGKCYLSVLRLCLSGEHPEKLFIANGQGRNGKGLINELAFKLLGQYAYKMSIEVLTKEVKKTGANPELANLHKMRMVVSSEPEDGCKIQTGFAKELTGCAEIAARGLYCGVTTTILWMVLIIELNKKLLLSGRMDTSVLERIVDIPFESTFVSNPDDVDESRGIYQGNLEYKTEAWQIEHSCAFFHYILENAPAELYIPDRIKNLSKQYVLNSDEMYGWVMENYETADNTEFVKVKDVFDLYKASDLYSNLTKLEKRNLSKKAFSELISNHIVLKRQFRNNPSRVGGKVVDCERIHGIKLKPPDDCDTDDEELGHQP